MSWMKRHPRYADLNRFADGELDDGALAQVASHLAACPRCREEVALIRRLAESTRSLPTPIATDQVLERALARRRDGERVLLPTSDAGSPKPRRAPARAAVAAMLTLLAGSLVVSVQVLQADKPALRILPERPTAGETLRVEYRGGALFADQTHLKLRARYRTARDQQWQLLAGILVRGDEGVFRTELELPDSVVYAAFAIEDLHGERLDSNNRQLWDVMVHGEDGVPTLEGLRAQVNDLEPRDWGEAYETALRMTELYPDEPQSWAARVSFELSLFEDDSIVRMHRRTFRRIEERLAEKPNRSADEMAWLAIYAINLNDLSGAEAWIRQAVTEGGADETVGDAQVLYTAMTEFTRPRVALEQMEKHWARTPGGLKSAADYSLNIARRLADSAQLAVWLPRYLSFSPIDQLSLAPFDGDGARSTFPATYRWQDASPTPPALLDAYRPLRLPLDGYARKRGEELQRVLTLTAELAALSGDEQTAVRLASSAVPVAWSGPELLSAATLLASAGHETGARQALVRALADPATEKAAMRFADSAGIPIAELEDAVVEAKRVLRDYVLAGSIVQYVDADLTIRTAGGDVAFEALRGGRPAIVVFVSRYCKPALDDLSRLARLAPRLDSLGAELLVIDIRTNGELRSWTRDQSLELIIHEDVTGAARSAFGSSASPDYFVLDAQGRVRFEHSEIDELERQLEALRATGVRVAGSFSSD